MKPYVPVALMRLNSGAIVAALYSTTLDGDKVQYAFHYMTPGGVWNAPVLYSMTKLNSQNTNQSCALTQHPNGEIWFFRHLDGDTGIGLIKLQEAANHSSIGVLGTPVNNFISIATHGVNGPYQGSIQLRVSVRPHSDPANVGVVLAYQSNATTSTFGGNVGTKLALCLIDFNGNKTFVIQPTKWLEQTAGFEIGVDNAGTTLWTAAGYLDGAGATEAVTVGNYTALSWLFTQTAFPAPIYGIKDDFGSTYGGRLASGFAYLSAGVLTFKTFAADYPSVTSTTWVNGYGGTSSDYGRAVALDASGNIFVAGYFSGTLNLGGLPLIAAGGSDLFIAKFSPAGVHVWSKRFGGAGSETVNSIALDSSGNIFIGGGFYGTANFGGANVTSAGDADAFLAKYSPEGIYLWHVTFGAASTDVINSIATDSQGNVIITGYYQGVVPLFSPYTSYGVDAFLAKFSTSGAIIWARAITSAGGPEYGNCVVVDKRIDPDTNEPYDRIVVTGYFNGGVDFGCGYIITTTERTGGYLAKLSPAGVCLWSRNAGLSPYSARPYTVALDSNGDVVISGDFTVQVDLGGGNILGTAGGVGSDAFLAKYSGSDGSYQWARPIQGTYRIVPASITTDAQRNIILAGNYSGTYNFGNQSLVAALGDFNGFLAKYTFSSAPVWAKSLSGPAYGSLNSVVVDTSDRPIVTGSFADTATFDGNSLTSAGVVDVILARINA
jgi:hypothetical protein